MPYETFLLSRSGPVATVTFNRPEKLNPIEEALTIGLVHRVVPLDKLQEETLAFADKLLSKPPMALRRTKEFFAALHTNRAGDITYADAHLGLVTFASEDMQEAVAAFREKRQGKFHNR